MGSDRERARGLVEQGNLAEALTLLGNMTLDASQTNELSLMRARLAENERLQREGTVSTEELGVMRRKLERSAFEFLNHIDPLLLPGGSSMDLDPTIVYTSLKSGLALVEKVLDIRDRLLPSLRYSDSTSTDVAVAPTTASDEESLRLSAWDQPRFQSLSVRIETNWTLYHSIRSRIPEVAFDERARLELRLTKTLSANVRETRSTQRIRVGRRQRKRTCWDCEREWKRMVVPLESGRPSEARQLLRTRR